MSTVTLSKPHCAITSAEKPDGIASHALTQALPDFSRALSLFMTSLRCGLMGYSISAARRMLAIIDERSMYSRAEFLSAAVLPHRVERFLPRRRIALADDLLVAVGLLLHRLDRDGAPLPVVAVEQAVVGAGPDRLELVGQIEGVLDAAVHAHAAERIVDMGGVAGEQHAAVPEALRHPLVHGIDRAVRDLVRLGPRHHALQHLLQVFVRQQLLAVGILRRRHQHAPQPRHPQQHQPFQRIGDVVHVGDVGQRVLERKVGRGDQNSSGIGEALELDAERAAHGAARAVGRDHVAARDLHRPGRRVAP